MTQPSARPLIEGIADITPILIGMIPFGLIAGIAAVEAGLEPFQAYAVSPLMFAGAAQLAMLDLIGRDATAIVVVATALVINTRFAMYSAALAPTFAPLRPGNKALVAYLLTDQAFAISVIRFDRVEETVAARLAYYLGGAASLWAVWQVTSAVGVLAGAGLPAEWSLDFTITLVFPAVRDRGGAIAAAVGFIAAVVFADLPLNLGLLAASATGIAAGIAGERR